jgi:hypothetical protein
LAGRLDSNTERGTLRTPIVSSSVWPWNVGVRQLPWFSNPVPAVGSAL